MPNQHKNPKLGWHPPAELSAWVRAEAARQGVDLKVILDEALSEYRASREQDNPATIRKSCAEIRKALHGAGMTHHLVEIGKGERTGHNGWIAYLARAAYREMFAGEGR